MEEVGGVVLVWSWCTGVMYRCTGVLVWFFSGIERCTGVCMLMLKRCTGFNVDRRGT